MTERAAGGAEAIARSPTTPLPDASTYRRGGPSNFKCRYGQKADQNMHSEKSSIKWRINSRAARVVVTTGTMAAAALTMAAPFRWSAFIIFNW